MSTAWKGKLNPAFAVWLTGRPASGKSTVAAELASRLRDRGIDVAVLDSDALSQVLTPDTRQPDPQQRETFYRSMATIGRLLADHGTPVIFDATAHLRDYRDRARRTIPRFVEVWVDCPPEVCAERDPKGVYRRAAEGGEHEVPGMGESYEPPEAPELTIDSSDEEPDEAAGRLLQELDRMRYLPRPKPRYKRPQQRPPSYVNR